MKNFRIESIVIAVGFLLLGLCIKGGFSTFTQGKRSVNVKGLAEMEVPADKVTWPLDTNVLATTWSHYTQKSSSLIEQSSPS